MREFIAAGADLNAGRRQNALDIAELMESKAKLLEIFTAEKGIDAAVRKYGVTALMLAAREGKTEIVKLLLDRDANIESKDNWGNTALSLAAWEGKTKTVALLLKHGANIEAQNKYGWTALMRAAWSGRTEIAKLLLEHGANIENS